jgi:dolichol-phosphate mannosyltransferase
MNLSGEIWIIIPTYNEAKNIAQLMNRILYAIPSAYLVIVDDSSPDGTAKIVCEVARSDERVHLLCRPAKLGYASAVVAGLQFALSKGASLLGYMDADLSHDPQALPLLVSAIQGGADLVIGSRYIAGGKVIGWGMEKENFVSLRQLAGANFVGLAYPRQHQRLSIVPAEGVGKIAVGEVES